jgi:hypothetical protein
MPDKDLNDTMRIALRPIKNDKDLDAFIQEFLRETQFNPIDARVRIWHDSVGIEIAKFNGRIQLQAIVSLEARGKGHATGALNWLCQLADKHKVDIELHVVPIGKIANEGVRRLNKQQLKDWYGRHGFVRNGHDDSMIRRHEVWPTGR